MKVIPETCRAQPDEGYSRMYFENILTFKIKHKKSKD